MNTIIRKLRNFITLLSLTLFVHAAQAGVVIDDFTDFQAVMNGEDGPMAVNGTGLSNLSRTISATASSLTGETEVVVETGSLNIGNSVDSNGTARLFYSFDVIDLAAVADRLLLDIDFIDLSQEIQVLANSNSVFGFFNPGGTGRFEIKFSQFSDPDVFKQLTSLELNFRGASTWDARFSAFGAGSNSVPEPSVAVLLAIGAMAFRTGHRKNPS